MPKRSISLIQKRADGLQNPQIWSFSCVSLTQSNEGEINNQKPKKLQVDFLITPKSKSI